MIQKTTKNHNFKNSRGHVRRPQMKKIPKMAMVKIGKYSE